MINLQQAFYGRDPKVGYRLLASSDSRYNKKIESLCASIGTPDGSSLLEPFYINHIDGDIRYMIAGCVGNADDAGRKTLFFHAYIGLHKELLDSNFGIGTLIKEKAFLTHYDKQPVICRSFEESNFSLPWGATSLIWDRDPLAIMSKKPELQLLTGLLRGNINNVSWASFTFRPLENCTIYILSEYAPVLPSDRKCIDSNGNLRRAIPQQNTATHTPMSSTHKETQKKNNGMLYLLCLSLLGNIALGYFAFGATKPKPPTTEKQISTKIQPPVEPEKPNVVVPPPVVVTREKIIDDLRREFLRSHAPIEGSWETALGKSSRALLKQKDNPFMLQTKGYVDFVNNTILNNKEK